MNKPAISTGAGRHMFAAGPMRHPLLSASPVRTDAIVASHERSRAFGLSPRDNCDFASPLASDFKITLESSARLYAQAQPVMELLLEQIVDTGSMVLLADNKGTILRTVGNSTFMEQAARVALRPGMSWAEASKGTNAIGTALMLESEFIVHSSEHFINSNHFLTCSAAPIMDHSGNVVGVLDVSGDERSFHPHTLGLVKMSARTIENYWFCDNFSRCLRLHFHKQPELIGTVAEGIIAIGAEGKVLGVNRAGLSLLGTSSASLRVQGIGLSLGLTFASLMDQLRSNSIAPLKIQCIGGSVLFARAHIGDPDLSQSIAMSAHYSASNATTTIPTTHAQVVTAIAKAVPNNSAQAASQQMHVERKLRDLHFGDEQMQAVIDKLTRVIDKNISIMILGDTGTGKEWLACAMHRESQRRHAPFVVVDCASIPDHLIEIELFGNQNATVIDSETKNYAGKLIEANGGTLFLDEIGNMPVALQARLLRVLQERRVTPIGSSESRLIDIQLICSTNRDIRAMVGNSTFRDDLYYRLNGLAVKLPVLRERTDFQALCINILRELSPQQVLHVRPALMQSLETYAWPGNLRQLHSVLRTAVSLCAPASEITLAHLSDDFREDLSSYPDLPSSTSSTKHPQLIPYTQVNDESSSDSTLCNDLNTMNHLQYVEIETIRRAVKAHAGNISKAAKQLNISRNTVYRKLKALDLQGVGTSK